jgi:hypothetical protein
VPSRPAGPSCRIQPGRRPGRSPGPARLRAVRPGGGGAPGRAAGPAGAAWWPVGHRPRARRPEAPRPRAAQPSGTRMFSASSDAPGRCAAALMVLAASQPPHDAVRGAEIVFAVLRMRMW